MKLNKKGFTLIELLAVVTIMGILMLVAIPAIARTIENTRRDTFNDTAKKYINAIRNAIIADELSCNSGAQQVSATLAGNYYFLISTAAIGSDQYIQQQTQDLLESGGKSSWGKNNVVGAVVWSKASNNAGDGFKITYYVFLVDAGNHGISTLTEEGRLTRASVFTNTSSTAKFTDMDTKSKLLEKIRANSESTLASFTATDAGNNKVVNATECQLQ